LIALLVNPFTGFTQIVSGNVFLQGSYIRLGLTSNAAFGSTIDAPAGFLPTGADGRNTPACNMGKIGFVADVGKDGWAVGTPYYIGEYFLPGTPEEGWAVSINGNNYNNNRSPQFITAGNFCSSGTQIPGSFTSFQDLPDRQVAEWEGIVDGLLIRKRITLPKDKLYFITEVKFINTTASTIKDAYYMRNVDPDNEVVPTGSFTTNNKIDFQNPFSGNKALVSASGSTYNSYLGLGTIDCRAKVCIKGGVGSMPNNLVNRAPRDVYDGIAPRQSALGDGSVLDAAIAIAFRLGNIAANDSVRFAFAYVLSKDDLEEGLSKTSPQFEINGSPVYSGSAAIHCAAGNLSINISNGDDYTWIWSPATGLNTTTGPSVIYTAQPNPVTYTVTGSSPVCNDAKLTLTVYPPNSNISNFITDSLCGNKTVTFTNRSPAANYLWDFGDGQISTLTSPVHTYAANGDYLVTLTLAVPAMPTCGNALTSTKMVHVTDAPVPVIGYSNDACQGSPVLLYGNATVAAGIITGHKWILSGGIIYNTQNISPVFSQPGTYDILYEVTSSVGCKAAVTKKITVESTPVAAFTAANGCVDKPLTLDNRSTAVSGNITRNTWDFGNGQTMTGITPLMAYTSPGNYNIQLTVATANGCAASISNTVNIETNPVTEFIYSPACLNAPVNFTNQSTNSSGIITAYRWNFDNGATSSAMHPSFTFNSDGNYRVSLTAVTANGCETSRVRNIIIAKIKPDAGKDTLVFKDTPFQLHAKGGVGFVWSPAVFLNDNRIANPVGILQQDQVFTVDVTDERGCIASDDVKVQVFDHDDIYVPTSFTPNNDGKNDVFRVIAPPGTVYLFEVYNRWGQKVFGTANQQTGWDGRLQGLMQPAGVFVWYLKAHTRAGIKVERKGTVTLIW
jgi:gliding motility-associated-like protein